MGDTLRLLFCRWLYTKGMIKKMPKGGLGKGLSGDFFGGQGLAALLGDEVAQENSDVRKLPISKVEPRSNQPRKVFDPESIAELADSIREHGVMQPIAVRKVGDTYQIIAGERRWRASREAGLDEIPALVIECDEQKAEELALVENLQREDLRPREEADALRVMMEKYSLSQEKVAEIIGKSRSYVANSLRLLNLPETVLNLLDDGKISTSHAKTLLELKRQDDMIYAANEVIVKGLGVRELSGLVKKLNTQPREREKPDRRHADGVDYYAEAEKALTGTLGRKVHISPGFKKGRFEIEYYDKDDFEVLYNALLQIKAREKN